MDVCIKRAWNKSAYTLSFTYLSQKYLSWNFESDSLNACVFTDLLTFLLWMLILIFLSMRIPGIGTQSCPVLYTAAESARGYIRQTEKWPFSLALLMATVEMKRYWSRNTLQVAGIYKEMERAVLLSTDTDTQTGNMGRRAPSGDHYTSYSDDCADRLLNGRSDGF